MCQTLICRGVLKTEPPESYERKLDTDETGRNNEADDTEKKF